jgi:UDP-glucuronate 4-epimerase
VRILVTGAAGFIGSHLCSTLIRDGHHVTGIDSLTDYYSIDLKRRRLTELSLLDAHKFRSETVDLSLVGGLDGSRLGKHDALVHLAAQPGVRLPPEQFHKYLRHNLQATGNVLDFAQRHDIDTVLLASSSSVYGDSATLPFAESDLNLRPTSLYGASKLACEVLAAGYSSASGLRTRAMRFFTVYGPWGRPDMAYFRLVAAALGQWNFELTGDGSIRRDFTYVESITEQRPQIRLEDGIGRVVAWASDPDNLSRIGKWIGSGV